MSAKDSISRREFVAGTYGLILAGSLGTATAASAATTPKLAIDGSDQAVQAQFVPAFRWGEPERKQLEKMLQQDSLFFWQGRQTTLSLERFREVCPVKCAFNCSSGTAALHIAVNAAGISVGDDVITSPVTDIGTLIGVLYQKAVPVFTDLGKGSHNLDVADVERRYPPTDLRIHDGGVHPASGDGDSTGGARTRFSSCRPASFEQKRLIPDCESKKMFTWAPSPRPSPRGRGGEVPNRSGRSNASNN